MHYPITFHTPYNKDSYKATRTYALLMQNLMLMLIERDTWNPISISNNCLGSTVQRRAFVENP